MIINKNSYTKKTISLYMKICGKKCKVITPSNDTFGRLCWEIEKMLQQQNSAPKGYYYAVSIMKNENIVEPTMKICDANLMDNLVADTNIIKI